MILFIQYGFLSSIKVYSITMFWSYLYFQLIKNKLSKNIVYGPTDPVHNIRTSVSRLWLHLVWRLLDCGSTDGTPGFRTRREYGRVYSLKPRTFSLLTYSLRRTQCGQRRSNRGGGNTERTKRLTGSNRMLTYIRNRKLFNVSELEDDEMWRLKNQVEPKYMRKVRSGVKLRVEVRAERHRTKDPVDRGCLVRLSISYESHSTVKLLTPTRINTVLRVF